MARRSLLSRTHLTPVLLAAVGLASPQAARPAEPSASFVPATDVVLERDSAGRVVVRREMQLDAAGNWVRSGAWQRWDEGGELLESGQFEADRRCGRWTRWIGGDEARRLLGGCDNFEPALVSQADFVAGQLHGEWVVFDAAGRRLLRGEFRHGMRHGDFAWWTAAGQLAWRQCYQKGLPVGERLAREPKTGDLVVTATYLDGYRQVQSDKEFSGSAGPRAAGMLLVGPERPVAHDDFAESKLARYTVEDEVLRHGVWRQWAGNGQPVMRGVFDRGRPEGRFEWRHPNGQLAVAGEYVAGRPAGKWQWWDPNGTQLALEDVAPPAVARRPNRVK